ncbi:hypothetical protein RJ641_007020 [Dillenia turbinata]|uniref:Uncharacterized protein n=1 Tax=Dillenia turbinata TaxID=194707 RepID=A0AAN8VBE7_9MAGN
MEAYSLPKQHILSTTYSREIHYSWPLEFYSMSNTWETSSSPGVQGIRPGDQLRIEEFYNAVYRERGFRPKVVCNNENQITEFRICFDTVGFIGHDAVNCGGSPYQTCKSDENATLPKA